MQLIEGEHMEKTEKDFNNKTSALDFN